MTQALKVAQAIAAVINAADITYAGGPVTAAAGVIVRWDPKELQALRIAVVPREISRTILDRTRDQVDLTIDVGIAKRCSPDDLTGVNALIDLTQSVEQAANRATLAGDAAAARWKGSEIDPLFDAELFHQYRIFMAVVTLNYAIL